jgi:acyl-CoA thioester hydrolase
MAEFTWALRVYYEDTDLAGIVYYANYLRYMERARTEWLRALGCEQDVLLAQAGSVFVVVRAALEYKTPSRFNDILLVDVAVTTLGRASVVVSQNVYRASGTIPIGLVPSEAVAELCLSGHLGPSNYVCTAEIRIACVSAKTLYPCPIPEFIYAELSRER